MLSKTKTLILFIDVVRVLPWRTSELWRVELFQSKTSRSAEVAPKSAREQRLVVTRHELRSKWKDSTSTGNCGGASWTL